VAPVQIIYKRISAVRTYLQSFSYTFYGNFSIFKFFSLLGTTKDERAGKEGKGKEERFESKDERKENEEEVEKRRVTIMTQTEEFLAPWDPLYRKDTQLGYLLNIKDQIIGHPNKKLEFMDFNFEQRLLDIIEDPETSADVRLQATIVFGSMYHGKPSHCITSS